MKTNLFKQRTRFFSLFAILAFGLSVGLTVGRLNAQVCFNPSVGSPFSAGTQPHSVISADFNADGKADLAVANNGSNDVSILLATGAGSFAPAVNFVAGIKPISLVSADFNADGKADLAVANFGSNNISVLLGAGVGSFTTAINLAVVLNPLSITSADFNADGKADLATSNGSSNDVSILLGNGTGSFAPAVNFGAGTNPFSVTNADFNADGKPDLATANFGSNDVSVLIATGTGSFIAAVNFTTGTNPASVISADFNADGKSDLAVVNNGADSISVLLGNGAGSFSPAVDFAVGTTPWSVTSADFNTDGKADLAVVNGNSNNVSILLGNGVGSFGSAITFAAGNGPHSITSTDFNADGKADLAVANGNSNDVSILLNSPFVTVNSATICSGQSATLVATGAATYSWNTGDTTASISINPTTTTVYTVTGTTAGCSNTQTTSVTVKPIPTFSVTSSPTDICVGSTATLSAISNSTGGITSYSWNTNATTAVIVVSPTTTTIYTVTGTTVSGTATGCSNTQTASVIVISTPTAIISAVDAKCAGFCNGKAYIIASGGAPFTYSWTSSSSTSSVAVNLCAGTYSCVVKNSCGLSITKTITVFQPPVLTSSISITGAPVCIGNTATLTSNTSGGTPAYSFTWSSGSSTASVVVTPTVMPTTSYTLAVMDAKGCKVYSVASLTVLPLPSVFASANNTLACAGQTINLFASGTAVNYLWQPINLNGSTQTVTINSPTTFTVYGKNSNGCLSFSNVFVDVKPITSVTPVVTPSIICAGSSAVLSVIGGTVTTWSSNSVPNTNVVTPNASTIFTVSATATNGCMNDVMFSVIVNQDCALIVYNAFSPNDDGLNDYFFIGNIEHFSNNKVFIYNRWGNKIFETTNYNNINNAWNGKLNGVTVPNGTYFYVINFNDSKDFIKSWVELTN